MIRASALLPRFQTARLATQALAEPLSAEDQMVQSCAQASPVKWHLAHTSWFFETFVLREFSTGYKVFDPSFEWLFNSYYNSLGEAPDKKLRASFSRPPLAQIQAFRAHVDAGVERLLQDPLEPEVARRLRLGIEHEQQHQELIATDIKHALFTNPLQPGYLEAPAPAEEPAAPPLGWLDLPGGESELGADGSDFAFDNELPRHKVFVTPFQLASRPVTCSEYLGFIIDRGYLRPELWLSEGWEAARAAGWRAPLYWQRHDESRSSSRVFTLHGWRLLRELSATPVCHVSFFEAEAYARWAGHRLPTEAEWELAAKGAPVSGNFLEDNRLHPAAKPNGLAPSQLFGDVWEWTRSPYTPYPGFKPLAGALGEYNGKFMSNQMVLRGGSAVTPRSHIRATYRNFFPPATRWQFSGIRLAADPA